MLLTSWLQKLFGIRRRRRGRRVKPKGDRHRDSFFVQLFVTRLEERRVLNAASAVQFDVLQDADVAAADTVSLMVDAGHDTNDEVASVDSQVEDVEATIDGAHGSAEIAALVATRDGVDQLARGVDGSDVVNAIQGQRANLVGLNPGLEEVS